MRIEFKWIVLVCVCGTLFAAITAHAFLTRVPRYGFEMDSNVTPSVIYRTDLMTGEIELAWPTKEMVARIQAGLATPSATGWGESAATPLPAEEVAKLYGQGKPQKP